jgi:hypothetical protein
MWFDASKFTIKFTRQALSERERKRKKTGAQSKTSEVKQLQMKLHGYDFLRPVPFQVKNRRTDRAGSRGPGTNGMAQGSGSRSRETTN